MYKSIFTRKPFSIILVALALLSFVLIAINLRASAQTPPPPLNPTEQAQLRAEKLQRGVPEPLDLDALSATPCVGGFAGPYPCENVDLLAFMPLSAMGNAPGTNDIWGWTDSFDGKEYALVGFTNGTGFVDVSDPENPVFLGSLPTHTSTTTWRDVKVYSDYAFIVSEASGHGMQIFDLTHLRNVVTPPVIFTEDAHYSGWSSAHNIVINEDTGFAYGVGTNTCSGGLHFVDISNPLLPVGAGCFSSDGYTHDAQCVTYDGPDTEHVGSEVCFAYNEDTLTIVDVTNKASPVQLSRTGYSGSRYTHQGWLTEDHVYALLGDELDENSLGHNTRTRVFDVSDLDAPNLVGFHDGVNSSIDHNLYTLNGYAYESNYSSGLQILDLTGIATASLNMVAFFDVYPANNSVNFNGTWSNYPYFASGIVIVTGRESGLFIVEPDLSPPGPTETPTPTATATSTPTPTATATPDTFYLPLINQSND